MASMLARHFLTLVATVLGLAAQNVTIPAVMNGVEGGSGSNVPFGSSLACRYQVLYDAGELPWTGPRQINGISLRADNGSPTAVGAAIAAKGFLVISVFMSTTHTTAAGASGTFAENHGEDKQSVLAYHVIQLPAQPALTVPGPRPANIDLMFTSPWYYGLTPARNNRPAPANLLVEIWIHSQPSGAYRIDNLGGCVATSTTFGNQGPLCAVPTMAPPTLTCDPSMVAGSNFSWYLDHGPPNAVFILAFNSTSQGGLRGNPLHPLPYPMFDPLNPSLPSPALSALHWPAPDCWLNIDPLVTMFGACNASGVGALTSQLPSGTQNVGFELFAQALILAQTANPLQVITTRGRSSTVCGPRGVARIYAFYDGSPTPPPPPPTAGAAQFGLGMIIEVR